MISLDDALTAYTEHLQPLPVETVSSLDALNRVLAAPAVYADDLPRFDQSAMDGYALRAADVAAASEQNPVRLPLAAIIAAGAHDALADLPRMSAVRIFTGAPLPPGADCMIPQEQAQVDDDVLVFTQPWPARSNIRWRGEEAHAGTPLAAAGQRIHPGLLAALVNAGVERVSVHRQPRIRVLLTGDEIRPLGSTLRPGEIVNSNGPLVTAVLTHWGYPAPVAQQVPDRPQAVEQALARALDAADLVLSCGGASVGDRDYLPATAERLGARRVFWKVAQKPAKPLFFGVRGNTAMLALPGNPGAVLIGLLVHVRRALDRLEGAANPEPCWHTGRLATAVDRDPRRDYLLRMRLSYGDDAVALIEPLAQQESHMLGNLGRADVLVRVPAGESRCVAGEILQWIRLPL